MSFVMVVIVGCCQFFKFYLVLRITFMIIVRKASFYDIFYTLL